MEYKFLSHSVSETKALGAKLAKLLHKGDVVLLTGDLGAGKTSLTKGIAEGLQIKERVNSPTFNILKLYLTGTTPLFHIDAYRLEDDQNDIGLDEFIGEDGISVIEWPAFIAHLLPLENLTINIRNVGEEVRELIFTATPKYFPIIEQLGGDK